MKRNRNIILAALGIPFLASCSFMDSSPKLAWNVSLVNSITASAGPEDFYSLGRYYQGQNRLDLAADAYRKALAVDAGFVEARNGLGVIHSLRGEYPEAIAAFKAALKISPESAHIHNNLGYAYYLQGKYQESLAALHKADSLNRDDPKILNNLGLVYAKINDVDASKQAFTHAGDVERRQYVQQAQISPEPERAAAKEQTLALPRDMGVALPESIPLEQSRMEVAAVSANVYELHPARAGEVSGKIDYSYRVEVSNGNGVGGMARQVGHDLKDMGFPVTRYTDHRPFDKQASEIQFRENFSAEAGRLSASLPMKTLLVKNNSLRWDIGVRLVLGKDMAAQKSRIAFADKKMPRSAEKRKS